MQQHWDNVWISWAHSAAIMISILHYILWYEIVKEFVLSGVKLYIHFDKKYKLA